jgi:peroxiredoxin (alkyl hydroperoxide reductase subunit C)
MAEETRTLKVGDPAPDFELKGPGGITFKLSDYKGNKNVVLAFFPAAFSGPCSQQMPTIERDKTQFEAADTQLAAISVDNTWSLGAWGTNMGITFPLLSDFHPKGEVSKRYGVYDEQRGVNERTLIAIDKNGIVRYIDMHPNLLEVPENADVLSCVSGL